MSVDRAIAEQKLKVAVVTQNQLEEHTGFVKGYFSNAEECIVNEGGTLWKVNKDTLEKEGVIGDSSKLNQFIG